MVIRVARYARCIFFGCIVARMNHGYCCQTQSPGTLYPRGMYVSTCIHFLGDYSIRNIRSVDLHHVPLCFNFIYTTSRIHRMATAL